MKLNCIFFKRMGVNTSLNLINTVVSFIKEGAVNV